MFYPIVIVQSQKMLQNLLAFLDRAQALADTKKFEIEVLLNARLAPDQFNFIRQVQIACDSVKFSASKLCNREVPTHPDTEKTLSELKERILKTTNYLKTFAPEDFKGAEERRISYPRWEGKTLSGTDFFQQSFIPNFYFHITTAYSILRHNGVNLGKSDFLGTLPLK